MYSAGYYDSQGLYIRDGFIDPTKTINDTYPEREASEVAGWDEITFTIETNTVHIEYYDQIIIGNRDKLIPYEFPFLYPIDDLDVVIMEPRTSSNFSVFPQGTLITHDAFGEDYPAQFYRYNDLTTNNDSPLQFVISYTKSDPRPSTEIQ